MPPLPAMPDVTKVQWSAVVGALVTLLGGALAIVTTAPDRLQPYLIVTGGAAVTLIGVAYLASDAWIRSHRAAAVSTVASAAVYAATQQPGQAAPADDSGGA